LANLSKIFFFNKQIRQIIWDPFWWLILMAIILWIPFLRVWWWLFFPLILSIELRTLYMWWMNWDYYYPKVKWVVLEITPPKEILTPLKAMEDVFTIMWGPLLNVPNWREHWCEGVMKDAAEWMSWEVASIEGNLHFYIRVPQDYRLTLETALYSHYPQLEIAEVPDYTKNVPQNIPNEEWDVYGEDFVLVQPSVYPIKTYEKFFEPQGEKIADEEKRLDPIASLLELMSRLGPNEQFWLQFITMGVDDNSEPHWKRDVKKTINKLAKRPEKKIATLWEDIGSVLKNLALGPQKEGSGEKATYKWYDARTSEEEDRELLLTGGEKELLIEVENKAKKPIYRTNIRGVYVAKRDNWKASHKTLTRSYFAHFVSDNLNSIKFSTVTRPKTHYIFRKRIPFLRARRQFRNFVTRLTPLFPDRKKEMALLNPEELATLYHFPIKITGLVAPTMSRVESKKGGPPPNLPME